MGTYTTAEVSVPIHPWSPLIAYPVLATFLASCLLGWLALPTLLQVINYLSKHVASEAAAVEEKKADLSAPEGFALMQRKKEDDQDAWMLGKGAGGKKGAKGTTKSKGE